METTPPPGRRLRRGMATAAIALLVAAAALVAYIRFEYTLVGDVREAFATVDADDPQAPGRLLFATRGCASCHALPAAGATATLGPDLDRVGARRTADELRQSLRSPAAVIATCDGHPCRATMPDYGAILSPAQVEALVAFLSAQR